VSSSNRTVSVVLAARDEAPTVADVVRGCLALGERVSEVLVVDDGSVDGTGSRAAAAGATVVTLRPGRGKGAAMRAGVAKARGDVLVFLDADGQDDPAEIPTLLDAIDDGADLVLGSRFLGRFEPGAITWVNRLGTRFLSGVMNRLFESDVTDPVAGFRAVTREAFVRAAPSADGYDIEHELVLGVISSGGRVAEVPVRRSARAHGASKLSSLRDGTKMLARIVRRRLSSARVLRTRP
jgi:glycosyltransferase involved in cell wall biosynthesis